MLVSSGRASLNGRLDTTKKLQLTFSLPLRNHADLDQLLASQYDPQSPEYRHWITPQEFDARFGPTREDFGKLTSWARENGFVITYSADNYRLITVEGSIANINSALHVVMNSYHDGQLNRDFHAPDREPTTALGLTLQSVEGLENSIPVHNHMKRAANADLPRYVAQDMSRQSLYGLPGSAAKGLTINNKVTSSVVGSAPDGEFLPSDMRAAYYGSGPLTGAGQAVAIFSFDGYLTSDLTLFYNVSNMPAQAFPTNVLVGGYSGACTDVVNGTSTCDDGEQILDIVQVQGMAPAAKIYFYEASSSAAEMAKMASDDMAEVITSSWGSSDFTPGNVDNYLLQMKAQGQTYLNATGDSGAFNASTYFPPSVDAYMVQVGGTDLVTNGPGGAWKSETGWPDSGGGYYAAQNVAIPSWQSQAGVINSSNAGSTTYRNSPDLAAEANFDNPTVNNGVYLGGYGGTSFATPRVAGYFALANQQAALQGLPPIGFPNVALYANGLNSTNAPLAYHDITSGSNPSSGGTAVSYNAVTGYDLVTGWGSPNGTNLMNILNGFSFGMSLASSSTMTLTRPTNTDGTAAGSGDGTPGVATVNITPYAGFSGSVSISATGLPTGVTAAYVNGTSSTPGSVTLTPTASAQPGSYTVTVTGTQNGLTESVNFPLVVLKRTAGDFTLSAASPSVAQGRSTTSVVTVSMGSGLVGTVDLAVSGLPAGVTASFSPNTTSSTSNLQLVAGSTTALGTYNLTITGTAQTGLTHSIVVPLTITLPPSLIANGGFETGTATPWSMTSGVLCTTASCGGSPHSGTYFAFLDGYGTTHTDTVSQQVALPTGSSALLGFYLAIGTAETTTLSANDTFTIQLTTTGGTVLKTLGTFSNLNATGAYVLHTYDISAYLGQTVVVKFTGTENSSKTTSFLLDDVYLTTN